MWVMSDVPFDQKPDKQRRGPPLLSCYDSLEDSCAYAWLMLSRGVKDARAPFHTPTVATVDAHGQPHMRTIVLRACDPEARRLRFHTDTRSSKVAQLAQNPNAAMHFYDAQAKIQLRLTVRLQPLSGDELEAAWAATRPMSRECYQVTQGPGTALQAPHDVTFDAAATDDGRAFFVQIGADIQAIEWLYLAAKGHRRALFDFQNGGTKLQWLVP